MITSDKELVCIMDAALADAVRRAGSWLACKPGCAQCCTGVFRISQLDAARLQEGLSQLEKVDASAAAALRERIQRSRDGMTCSFPGDIKTGVLADGEDAEAAFEEFGDDEVCPVLNPLDGTCTLYSHRPMTCRTFGPPVATEAGFGTCELCFQGAPDSAVAAAELHLPPPELEEQLILQLGNVGETIVAFAFQPTS